MLRALAFGSGIGLVLAWYANRPPMPQASGAGFIVLSLILGVLLYKAGTTRRAEPAHATAVANAHAQASNVVNLNVEAGAMAAAAERYGGLDRLVDHTRPELLDEDEAAELADSDPARVLAAEAATPEPASTACERATVVTAALDPQRPLLADYAAVGRLLDGRPHGG